MEKDVSPARSLARGSIPDPMERRSKSAILNVSERDPRQCEHVYTHRAIIDAVFYMDSYTDSYHFVSYHVRKLVLILRRNAFKKNLFRQSKPQFVYI